MLQRLEPGSDGRTHSLSPVHHLDRYDGLAYQLRQHLIPGGTDHDENGFTAGVLEHARGPDDHGVPAGSRISAFGPPIRRPAPAASSNPATSMARSVTGGGRCA